MPATSHHPARRRLLALAAAATLALVLGACSDDSGGNVVADAEKDKSLPTQVAPTTLADASGKPCKEATDVPEAEGKPEVEMPVGEVPAELESTDITPGTGAEAALGKTIKVHYIGIACSTGTQFDSSWDRGEPTEFPLTEGGLIQGWIEGIPGMKVGGRRMLVIPGDLAYGEQGNQGIPPGEALVFVIDLVDVTDTPTSTSAPAEGGATTAPAEGGSTTAPAEGGATTAPAEGSGTTAPESTTTSSTDPPRERPAE
ncbi:MAG TPA: FKBP-type peptidyl-prolyl cis-trans isomerase [Acidimicrobiales bacterium]|nr:FKBP-type peptidyl-prolyl cis-trans isomerase [Acidimicrobiales bacterium]